MYRSFLINLVLTDKYMQMWAIAGFKLIKLLHF